MIKQLRQQYLIDRQLFDLPGEFPNEAGILIPITDHPDSPDIILTLRADHLSSHSGEVSFPGGKWEVGDRSLVVTALRESQEEIGLDPADVEVVNVQQPMMSRWGIKVTPFVGLIPHDIELVPNPDEIAAVFRVPLDYFVQDNRTHTDVYDRQGESWWAPVYHYDGYKVWGLTSKVLVEFLNSAWGLNIGRDSSAPEIERKPLRADN